MKPFASFLLLVAITSSVDAADPVFSGPQVGERALPFKARSVFGEQAGQPVEVMGTESPTLLIFVHEITRPAIGLTRLLANFAQTKKKAGLKTHLVFLTNDGPETEQWMNRARHALPEGVPPLVSLDGLEGPGSYGLNRHVQLTILVANDGKVTGNFAVVQPSIQVDGPKIGHAIAKVTGDDKQPTLEQMGFQAPRMRGMAKDSLTPEQNGTYRSLMAPVIRGKTEAEVDAAAKAVEDYASQHAWFKNKVHSAASMIVGGGKLENYGQIPKAREYLKKWASAKTAARPVDEDNAANDENAEREDDTESNNDESNDTASSEERVDS